MDIWHLNLSAQESLKIDLMNLSEIQMDLVEIQVCWSDIGMWVVKSIQIKKLWNFKIWAS